MTVFVGQDSNPDGKVIRALRRGSRKNLTVTDYGAANALANRCFRALVVGEEGGDGCLSWRQPQGTLGAEVSAPNPKFLCLLPLPQPGR